MLLIGANTQCGPGTGQTALLPDDRGQVIVHEVEVHAVMIVPIVGKSTHMNRVRKSVRRLWRVVERGLFADGFPLSIYKQISLM